MIVGKQSIDSDNGQVGQMTAALLDWSQGTFAAKVAVSDDKKSLTVDRETDKGSEQISITLPSVITADLRLNEPRYATLPNIMKVRFVTASCIFNWHYIFLCRFLQAKKKPIETLSAEAIGIDLKGANQVIRVEDPPARKAGVVVDSVDSLLDKLRNEAKVI